MVFSRTGLLFLAGIGKAFAGESLTAGSAPGDFSAVQCWALAARCRCGRLVPDKRHYAVGAVTAQAAAAVARMALRPITAYLRRSFDCDTQNSDPSVAVVKKT